MQANDTFDVSIELPGSAGEHAQFAVKLQAPNAELNIWLTRADARSILAGIPSGLGVRALSAGTSAGAQLHWALGDSGELYILAGHDDETWDFSVTLSPANYSALIEEIKSALASVSVESNSSLERTRER
jgi:hypothetical protein